MAKRKPSATPRKKRRPSSRELAQCAVLRPLPMDAELLVMAGMAAGKSVDEIAHVCGVDSLSLTAQMPLVNRSRDYTELKMVAALIAMAQGGDREAAKFILAAKYDYRATSVPQPPKEIGRVRIMFDLRSPEEAAQVGLVGQPSRVGVTIDHDDGADSGFEFDDA